MLLFCIGVKIVFLFCFFFFFFFFKALSKRDSEGEGGQVEVLDSEWGGASFRMTWAYAE